MLIADKKKITLPIEYPKSSLIIKNPHHKLALMFQISVSVNRKDNNDNDQQEVQDIGVMVKRQTFYVKGINVFPLRGILLPGGQQLISVEGIILPTRSKITSQFRKSKPKRQTQSQQTKQTLISTIIICSSYLLEMNKQHFKQQMIKNSQSLLPQSKIDINKLSQIQTFMYEIYLEYKQSSSAFFLLQGGRTRHKYSLPEKMQQHYQMNQNKSSNNNGLLLINSLNINDKRPDLQNVMSMKPQNDKQFQKTKQFKEQQNQDKDKKNQFENSKLNQDYDLIRNKTTLGHIQTKRSNQLFKIFQSSQSQIKKDNKKNSKNINNKNNNNSNNNNNQNNDMLTKAQRSPILASQNIINFNDNNNSDQKLIPPPPVLNANEKIDQSIVIESFRHHHSKKSNKYDVEKDRAANYRSVQVLVLAIIAAIFLSLGNNLRGMMFR